MRSAPITHQHHLSRSSPLQACTSSMGLTPRICTCEKLISEMLSKTLYLSHKTHSKQNVIINNNITHNSINVHFLKNIYIYNSIICSSYLSFVLILKKLKTHLNSNLFILSFGPRGDDLTRAVE